MQSSFSSWFLTLGHHGDDSEDEKLRKSSLLIMSAPFAFAGLLWGALYFANKLYIPGAIPFVYGILSILSIVHFAKTTKYKFFRNSQLLLILILPFALQTSLGGFIPGSVVIIWAIIAPIGALVFHSIRRAVAWFAAYILLIIVAYIINDMLLESVIWEIGNEFIIALILMNVIGVSSIVFMIQYYFVSKQRELKSAIELNNMELESQSEKLKEMDKVKSRFFANISHEFRTPLTLIIGILKKQLSDPQQLPSPKDTDTMKRNSDRLLQLINQLLDLSKLESGEMKLRASKNDIYQFVENLIRLFQSAYLEKNIIVTLNGQAVDKSANEALLVSFVRH